MQRRNIHLYWDQEAGVVRGKCGLERLGISGHHIALEDLPPEAAVALTQSLSLPLNPSPGGFYKDVSYYLKLSSYCYSYDKIFITDQLCFSKEADLQDGHLGVSYQQSSRLRQANDCSGDRQKDTGRNMCCLFTKPLLSSQTPEPSLWQQQSPIWIS